MKLYCGIDLHSNNNYMVVINENDKIVFQRKNSNNATEVLQAFAGLEQKVEAIAVESTYNWYWLVDLLMDNEMDVKLVNTSKVKQYEGLKHSDDKYDAFHLAHLLRLGVLPTGYIYPRQQRDVRDLLRRRTQLVKHRTSHLLSIQNQITRNTGIQLNRNEAITLSEDKLEKLIDDKNQVCAITSNMQMYKSLTKQIVMIEKQVNEQVKLKPEYQLLREIDGIGLILSLTIMLETGDISRFSSVGNYASYCRCVSSKRMSNGKKKGEGNTKNGNKYLSWAYIEAANFAIRFNSDAKSYYQRKAAKTKRVVALKAVAHKMARACYFVIKNQEPFDSKRLFH